MPYQLFNLASNKVISWKILRSNIFEVYEHMKDM